jgi:hypothetical protein
MHREMKERREKEGEKEGREHKAGENGRVEGEDGRLEQRTNICESERKEGRKV